MKNKEFHKLLRKNKSNSNSGFTLTELLVGLIMSIFVIGALGFGLMTVLRTTQSETSKVKARNENSRALDFISDEVRRARNIETSAANAGTAFSATDSDGNTKTIVLALDIPEISSSTTAGTNGRIIYYLKTDGNANWKGPQVLYRWGPPLDANGNYTTGIWSDQALLDGIDDQDVTTPCTSGTATPATPQGFYACLSLQDSTAAYEPDEDSDNYNPRNSAQLFLTGQTKTAFGVNDSQTNDSQVVARARTTLPDQTDTFSSIDWSVQGLGGAYSCTPGGTTWDMKTDFSNSSDTISWTQSADGDKQPQPIEIDSDQPLIITSTPINGSNCISASAPILHTINFGNPTTFNGDCDTQSTSGTCSSSALNQTRVNGDIVQFFKKGYSIGDYGGYDANNDGVITIPYDADGDGTISAAEGAGTNDQPPLGRFLHSKGLAIPDPITANPNLPGTNFKIPNDQTELDAYLSTSGLSATEKAKYRVLGEDQRIVGFEMGQTDTTHPGFDLQDNIFIVTSSKFAEKFAPACFPSGCPAPSGN